MPIKKGLFIVSLDFELLWGVRDKRTVESYGENLRGVRHVIPALLALFDRYGIHATFATVGFLFARNRAELLRYCPAEFPVYSLKKYSPYENGYTHSIGESEGDDIYHYAESLIRLIQTYPEQEIGSHTFSHYYCLENASLASFEADLAAAKAIAAVYGIDLKSIVFPRNQYSEAHIDVCRKLGFVAYRGNEQSSVYDPRKNDEQSKWIRATRLADSYINLTGHHTFSVEKNKEIINIPASRFLRPFSPRLKALDALRLTRIKKSMTYAARNGEGFHLWWHPHNFGVHLGENLRFLEEILKHFKTLNREFGMQSLSMKEVAEEIYHVHEA